LGSIERERVIKGEAIVILIPGRERLGSGRAMSPASRAINTAVSSTATARTAAARGTPIVRTKNKRREIQNSSVFHNVEVFNAEIQRMTTER
jgi:type II secretory pathway component PulM